MKDNPAMARLRHHVTGAVERGEAEPITEQPVDDRAAWREEAAGKPPLSGIGPGAGKSTGDYLAERARRKRARCRRYADAAAALGFRELHARMEREAGKWQDATPRTDIDGAVRK